MYKILEIKKKNYRENSKWQLKIREELPSHFDRKEWVLESRLFEEFSIVFAVVVVFIRSWNGMATFFRQFISCDIFYIQFPTSSKLSSSTYPWGYARKTFRRFLSNLYRKILTYLGKYGKVYLLVCMCVDCLA